MAWRVIWPRKVDKQLSKLPDFIRGKFLAWGKAIEEDGLPAVRRLPGFHDEPLKGHRKGQRSVRLNRACRAIYVERTDGGVELVDVQEVNKHEY